MFAGWLIISKISKMKHLLGLEGQGRATIERMVDRGMEAKAFRFSPTAPRPLVGQSWALIFSKSSTRTRVSFEVGLRELGATPMYLSSRDLQLGRGEPIADTARVLGRWVSGAVIRTFDQQDVVDFAEFSKVPTINALTDEEHPCQVLADLMTIREKFGTWDDRKVVFLGDGDNNMSRSWIWAAAQLGFPLVIAAPEACQPSPEFMAEVGAANISVTSDITGAVGDASVLYTDVWVSMGQESKADAGREEELLPYQINRKLVSAARPDVLVLHCLPAYRGKEISEESLEDHADSIFTQAENRLHVQKGVVLDLVE